MFSLTDHRGTTGNEEVVDDFYYYFSVGGAFCLEIPKQGAELQQEEGLLHE